MAEGLTFSLQNSEGVLIFARGVIPPPGLYNMKKTLHIVATLVAYVMLAAAPTQGSESSVEPTQQASKKIACFEDLRGKILAVPSSTVQDIYV